MKTNVKQKSESGGVFSALPKFERLFSAQESYTSH